MKFKISALSLGILLSLSNITPANTDYVQGSVLSDKVFYQIGGGSAIAPPPARKRANEYSLGIGWRANLMCGNFDLKTTVKNQLNGITEGFKDLYSNVIQSATGAVASLPAMIIQRANPQLYDILTNGLYQGKIDFDNLKTSCEEMSEQLADYAMDSKWAKMAGLENYKKITESEPDAKKAKKKLESEQGENGTPWVGGEARGGKGQKSLELIGDVIGAGFNMAQGRNVLNNNPIPKTQCDGMLCTEWQSPQDMRDYAMRILGEKTMKTCDNCGGEPKKTKPGRGLAPEIEAQTKIKATQLENILNTNDITNEKLTELSTSTVAVTRGLIEALKEDPDAPILGARLAQELAISKELEKALVLRRVLLTGMREPNVANNAAAQEDLEVALKMLDREIEQVKLEMDLQKSISNNTAIAILNNRITDQLRSLDSNANDNSKRLANLSGLAGKNDTDTSLGGALGFPKHLQERYILIPRSEEASGLGNIYASYAPTNPSSSSGAYSPIGAISGTAMEQASGLLKTFEGYSSKAYWDVNAYRTGYGSDTITKADGTIVRVTKDTIVTREDAERDLARRTQEFANIAKREVSPETWNALSPQAQAVLTSYAYNYGTLRKTQSVITAARESAATGDMTALANAIRNRQNDNKGSNARRRNQEADYILNKS